MNKFSQSEIWGEPDWGEPIDLSWPLQFGNHNPKAFHIPAPTRTPLRAGGFVGSVREGGSCNVFELTLHPHGQGTHTECLGHITPDEFYINDCLKKFWFRALLLRVEPLRLDKDWVIGREELQKAWDSAQLRSANHTPVDPEDCGVEALIVCCALDTASILHVEGYPEFSGSNPPYFSAAALELVREWGVEHLLTNLPSVDREDDGGRLLAHHAFWHYPQAPRMGATITELIRVPGELPDGLYYLNLMIAPLQSDASPSKPVLYRRLGV